MPFTTASAPLTVERGKVVLAEFGYGGRLLPTFPFLDATKPSRLAWSLETIVLPRVYFDLMLKGREWLAEPETRPARPISSDVAPQVPNS
jgi:sulfide:quinone oxidoreductase